MSTIPLLLEAQSTLALIPLEGLLDLISRKNTQTQTLLRGIAITLGVVFVIIQGVSSRGSLARIIVSGLAAGLFIWVVWNVTDVRDKVGSEFGAPAYISVVPINPPVVVPAAPSSPSWA